jgi:hypothetical protein
MGASTALLVAMESKCVSTAIIDSPYTSINGLLKDIGNRQLKYLKFLVNMGLKYIKNKV